MRHIHLTTFVAGAFGVLFAGCNDGSGGGGGAAAPVSAGPPAPAPAAPAPAPPDPAPATPAPTDPAPTPTDPLDVQLRAALSGAGITAIEARASESAELIALGEALFFDKELSGNRNISCASCHHPNAASADGLPLSLGEGASGTAPNRTGTTDQVIARNAPALWHVGAAGVQSMFWDSRVRRDDATGVLTTPEPALNGAAPTRDDIASQLTSALAAQALFPVGSHEEMRGDAGSNELADAATNEERWALLMARLVGTSNGTVGGIDGYRTLFQAAFPGLTFDELNFGHAGRAIAAYEASAFAKFDSPLQSYLQGDDGALTDPAKRGGLLFTGAARCANCHDGPLLSDFDHHALAVPQLGPGAGGEPDDRGLALETGTTADDYRFRTPPLINVELTGPYFHSGAFQTLGDVLRHYNDPDGSIRNYDPDAELPAFFRPLVDTDAARIAARIAAVDPIVGGGIRINQGDRQDLLAFLRALTDPAARTPVPVPATVPSGLAVAD